MRILLLLLLMLAAFSVTAQTNVGVFVTGNGVPTTALKCGSQSYLDLNTGLVYPCNDGLWGAPLTFSISQSGSANISTVGTVNTGTWNATVIADGKIAPSLTSKSYAGSTVTMTGAILSSGGGIGYTTGAGGAVTQLTNKSTGVTLNKLSGTITMNGAALAAAAIVTFTVTDSFVAATDVIVPMHDSAGTIGAYTITATRQGQVPSNQHKE
jgi:hypothetical protein